ncbi:histidine phosphatase family protein [Paenibacillus hamazuiensis]|uniref:histidine phosphatase family protein n=1 Tax=Paenibacillus hamazuiensis TaxID=2936508 RepID=UPI0020102518|nr:histidine phosphatase family protein [Paenibacillus hamazuiensis]
MDELVADLPGTTIYFIRHAESPYTPGNERERGLSDKGREDAQRVSAVLAEEQIELFVSSPYERAIRTIAPLAAAQGKDIAIEEDLRERKMAGADFIIGDRFIQSKQLLYEDFNYSFLGGESSREAQHRAIDVILRLLDEHKGKKIAIGTHGDIMTLMMNYFDPAYNFEFWKQLTMPDIYRLLFKGTKLVEVDRMRFS